MNKVSTATKRNWQRLNIDEETKILNHRANKRMSQKIILPIELFKNKTNIDKIKEILQYIDTHLDKTENLNKIMQTFCIKWFIQNGIVDEQLQSSKNNVKNFIKKHKNIYKKLLNFELPNDEDDILGILYQCLQTEGNKNEKGSYYTPSIIVDDMIARIKNNNNIKLLDPCCGTGMFLLGSNIENPKNLYGIDIDKIAIMIAKANLIVKYKNIEFEPNIYNFNFITENVEKKLKVKFDYIVTNPPWGSNTDDIDKKLFAEITSGESFSYILLNASKLLNENGKLLFLLPESFLNVKVHADIRKYLLEDFTLKNVTLYPSNFSGVVTKFISIEVLNEKASNYNINISNFENIFDDEKKSFVENENYVITLNTKIDKKILKKVFNKDYTTLKNSKWALGIVTGNNKNILKQKAFKNGEPIYTGKEISRYRLLPCKNYINYKRENFQQVAPDEIYRAKEKLVYKFISKNIAFAYDNKGNLFLNSANILVPNIEGMSIKTVMAFLNSPLFQYIYIKKFREIKILKGNLSQLPFPLIDKKEDKKIVLLVDKVLQGNDEKIKEINNIIYDIYNLTKNEIKHIEGVVNGKSN